MVPYTDQLRGLRQGRVSDAATEKMAEVVNAVLETRKSGSITVTLKINPPKGDDDALRIMPSISTKIPEKELPEALMFADADGGLHREPLNGGALFSAAERDSDRDDRRDRREG